MLSNIENLSMKSNKFNSDSCSFLADILRADDNQDRRFVPIQSLDLRSNELKKGVAEIGDALAQNTVLTTLSLRDNKIEEGDLVNLIRGLVCFFLLTGWVYLVEIKQDVEKSRFEWKPHVWKRRQRWTLYGYFEGLFDEVFVAFRVVLG